MIEFNCPNVQHLRNYTSNLSINSAEDVKNLYRNVKILAEIMLFTIVGLSQAEYA